MYKFYYTNGYVINSYIRKSITSLWQNAWNPNIRNWLMRINLTCLMLLIAFMQVSLAANAQKISLSKKNAPLTEIFKELRKQSGYDFVINKDQIKIAKLVTILVNGDDLVNVLNKCFEDQPFTYSMSDKMIIVISKKPEQGKVNDSSIDVSGKIVDGNGEPIVGATIKVKGSFIVTKSNDEGIFTLGNVVEDAVLEISYLGYQTREIRASKELGNIKMELSIAKLEEVTINAGYYTVKDKERTGNITKIKSETIVQQPVSNPIAALQGRVAGLFITQRNGLPGSDFNVQLRGRNSIQSGTSPLYLIDGVPFISETLAQSASLNANSPFNSINPTDIESIEVLKDADATAIYGSRGANGVILITTKKGKAGSTTADFDFSTGVGKITQAAEFMNTEEYIQMRKEAFGNNNVTPTLANAPDLLGWDNTRYTDFKDLLIGGTSKVQNAQFRLSGGNSFTTFSFGANYYRETTVYPGESFLERKSANLNLNHSSSDKKFNVNLSGSYSINNSDLFNIELGGALSVAPNLPELYDENGKLNWAENGISFSNPLGKTLETNRFKTDRFTTNAVLGYKILNGLELKATAGFNAIALKQYANTPIASLNPANAPTGLASFGDNQNQTWIAEPQLNYSPNIGSIHKITMLIGATWQGSKNTGTLNRGTGYTSDLLLGSIEAAATKVPSNTFNEYTYQAIYGRINYGFKERYILNFTGRRDGSSRFGPGQKFANFGAVGAAWLFSEEKFIQRSLPWFSFGKLRASYGLTGNDQISNYQYLDSYVSTIVYGSESGLIPNRLFNEDYGWEENKKLETALELGFFKDRIRLSAGYFRNISGNQLVSYSLPAQTGFSSILRNLNAKIENEGFEFELNTINLKSSAIKWSTSANLTISRNSLLEFPGLASSSYANTYAIGEPLGIIRGYEYVGINQTTGAYEFKDRNGDGLVNTMDYYNIGTKDPSFYGGLQNSLNYKGISLDLFFQFVKQKGTDMVFGSYNLVGTGINAPRALLDRWTPSNPGAKYQAYSQSSTGPVNQARTMMPVSDAALVDASFIRLKNVALSYNLSKQFVQQLHLKAIRVYAQGQNLLTFTSYLYLDPESQSISTLPPLKMFTMGLQITL